MTTNPEGDGSNDSETTYDSILIHGANEHGWILRDPGYHELRGSAPTGILDTWYQVKRLMGGVGGGERVHEDV